MKNALSLVSPWFNEFDDLMDRFLVPTSTLKPTYKGFNPLCDVEETDSHYLMSFDLPGVLKENIKIETADNQLTVSGERKTDEEQRRGNRHVSERYHGTFKRTFALPTNVDSAKVEAFYKDGVLAITIPKAEASKPRQIQIAEAL